MTQKYCSAVISVHLHENVVGGRSTKKKRYKYFKATFKMRINTTEELFSSFPKT